MSSPRRSGRRPGRRVPPPGRVAAALGLAVVLGWGVVATSGAALLRSGSPDAALRLAPWDAYAWARVAERRTVEMPLDDPSAFRPIAAMAEHTVVRDPTIASAWRTLGLSRAVAGDGRGAAALISAAERVSRRDLPSQFWLIEDAVRRGDIPGALDHYDVAMRVRPNSTATLVPVMVAALDVPEVRPAVARLVASNPPWAGDFFYVLAQKPLGNGIVSAFFHGVRARGRAPTGPAVDAVLSGLIARERFAEAASVLSIIEGRWTMGVRDGGFDRPGSHPPFDWQLADDAGLNGEVREPSNRPGNPALFGTVSSSGAGDVARQLLTLSPGRHRLDFRAGTGDLPAPEVAEWHVTCAGTNTSLAGVPVRTSGTRQSVMLSVPDSGCGAQWLSLYVRAGSDPQGAGAWIDDVGIVPAR